MTEIIIRKATRQDCKEIMRLVQELADFEKMSDCVKLDAKTLEQDGFDCQNPPFECLVVEDSENKTGGHQKLIGYAFYSKVYGTWEGKRYWLEDIMISQKYRDKGIGKKLLSAVCKEAIKEDIKSIKFVVLEWNPANEFYKKFGMVNGTKVNGWQYSTINYDDIVKHAGSC